MKPIGFPLQATRIPTIRIIEWITRARQQLAGISDTPGLDSELLVAKVKNRDRTWVLTHPEHWIEPGEEKSLQKMLNRRLSGEPLPYILGEWEFYGRKFTLNSSVLIPRPETEILVEAALGWLHSRPGCRKVLDVGTGSGSIAITLASEITDLEMTASDISPQALEIAEANASKYHLSTRIRFIKSDLLADVPGRFHLVCANLPYIPSAQLLKNPLLSFEPLSALDGGVDGMSLITQLLKELPGKLIHPSLVLLEIQYDQGEPLLAFARDQFPSAKIQILPDLSGLPRTLRIECDG
jgi:release factor glutamine methyltransferase